MSNTNQSKEEGSFSGGATFRLSVADIARGALEAIEAGDKAHWLMNVEGVKANLRSLLAASAPAIADPGPWQVDEWSDGRIVLQSHHFEHDVALVVTGDFADKAQKLDYARRLAEQFGAFRPRALSSQSEAR